MNLVSRLMAPMALRMMWTNAAFPGRWRVQRWARNHSAIYERFPYRRVAMDGFGFVVDPGANIDVYLNGITPSSPIERIIRAHVKPGDTTLDIGANLGWTSRLLSSLVGPTGHVHAFEPIPSAFSNLRSNIDAAPIPNITAHLAAASDECGKVDLYMESCDATALATMRPPGPGQAAQRRSVETLTIDSLIDGLPRVAFAKIDVEGAEHKVLVGMERLIARDRPVLAIELSDAWLRKLGSSAQSLIDHLAARDYELFRFQDGRHEKLQSAPAEQVDVVCIAAH